MKTAPAENKLYQYVAFLRGINVGGKTLVKMEELRKAFESLGFHNVKTVLASGNVIFCAHEEDMTAFSKNITNKLEETFGRKILVIVRSIDNLRALEAEQPFKDVDATPRVRLLVTFLLEYTKRGNNSSLPMSKGFKVLSVSDGIICSVLYEQPGIGTVDLMSAIEKEFGPMVTTRTWNTIIKILNSRN